MHEHKHVAGETTVNDGDGSDQRRAHLSPADPSAARPHPVEAPGRTGGRPKYSNRCHRAQSDDNWLEIRRRRRGVWTRQRLRAVGQGGADRRAAGARESVQQAPDDDGGNYTPADPSTFVTQSRAYGRDIPPRLGIRSRISFGHLCQATKITTYRLSRVTGEDSRILTFAPVTLRSVSLIPTFARNFFELILKVKFPQGKSGFSIQVD